MKIENVLVTGATSFIGKYLVAALLKHGYQVFAVVRNPDKLGDLRFHNNLITITSTLDEIAAIPEKINTTIDVVYHLAWEGTRGADRDNYTMQQNNIYHSLQVIYTAKQLGCHTFIGVGSQAEYGICEGIISETYPENPCTEYGKAKLHVCREGLKLAHEFQMKFIWCRVFSAYGVGDFEGSLVNTAVRKMLINEPIALTECIQNWDYVHITDVANAFLHLLDAPTGVYNIANGESKILREFIYEIKDITGSESELQFGSIPYTNEKMVSFIPSVDKLKLETGWFPVKTFREGIAEIIEEQRKCK